MPFKEEIIPVCGYEMRIITVPDDTLIALRERLKAESTTIEHLKTKHLEAYQRKIDMIFSLYNTFDTIIFPREQIL